ncbi:MAG: signal peptidase II [Victivallaceae bacterium]|nr:signal peptidase II [Victivallaceae bacterium]
MTSWLDRLTPGSLRERIFCGVSIAAGCGVLLADQCSKQAVVHDFSLGESRPVIDGFFSLTYVINYGAVWSMFSGRGTFLLSVALIVAVLMIVFFRRLTENCPERVLAAALVFGGMAGNSIDRLWRGGVVDFLDCYYRSYHWPVFNVADIAICTGVGLFILSSLARKENSDESRQVKDDKHGE